MNSGSINRLLESFYSYLFVWEQFYEKKINKIVYIQVKTDSQNTPDVNHGTSPGDGATRKGIGIKYVLWVPQAQRMSEEEG